jgi:DNA-binding Lrp family transcriptional regulator
MSEHMSQNHSSQTSKKQIARKEVQNVKNIELRLVSELMKNGRRSDRELAKAIGVSQPTVTRLRSNLEKIGIIKEYTIIPDFTKLGFEILAITLIRRPKDVSAAELDKLMAMGQEIAKKKGAKTILALRGIGLDYDVAVISVHENYASFLEVLEGIREFPSSDAQSIQSFVISLKDEVQYRALTFSHLANYLKEKSDRR